MSSLTSIFPVVDSSKLNPQEFTTLQIDVKDNQFDNIEFGSGRGDRLDEKQTSKIYITSIKMNTHFSHFEATIYNAEDHPVDIILLGSHTWFIYY